MKAFISISFIIFSAFIVSAQTVTPFTIRHQVNQKGGLVMLANVSVDCNGCSANNELPPGGSGNNNSFSATYTDIDTDPSTFMSSSDQLALASCSEITWAGLYWTGLVSQSNPASTPNYAQRSQVKLKVDGGAYQTLTADQTIDNTVNKNSYYCFKDVTAIAQANQINSTYTVADVVTFNGNNTFGGWTLVVVYKNIYESMRNITVFNGLSNISIGASTTTPISGFLTPPAGPVEFELGVVAHDGDRGDTGDQLSFDGTGTFVNISDALHPISNSFNSTITNNGVLTPNRIPNYNNNLGHDASIYVPDNSTFSYLGNSATSANIRIASASESVLASVITSVIDIYEPDLRASVSYTDLNGGTVVPGDILEYSIVSKNIGSDVSLNTTLVDTLDPRLSYIPNSLNITFGPNSGPKTDPIDTDQAEFIAADNVIRARIGTGANGTNGGSVVNSSTGADSTVITFQVQLLPDCPVFQCGSILENRAYLFGTGQISGITNSNGGTSDELDVNGCPSLESGIVLVDVSQCADTVINHTDSLCVGELLSLDFPNSGFLTYEWSGPNNFTSSINNPTIPDVQLINAGDYVLHVFYEGVECITDTTAPVFVSDNPTINLNQLENDSCFNLGSGFINVSGVGNAPFDYLWSNSDTDSLAGNLGAGTYDVLVTDQYGCTASDTFDITEPDELIANASILSDFNGQNISCFGASDAIAAVDITGGTLPYDILWVPTAQTTDTIYNLSAGLYVVNITDSNGCEALSSVLITEPDTLTLTASITDILCFDDTTGAIDVTIQGGTQPYSIIWSSTDTTEDISNASSGLYTDTVTDINGCQTIETFEILEPADSISIQATSSILLCLGDTTGTVNLVVRGGVFPYTFLWSNGDTTQNIFNLGEGTYTVVVTDANGCTQTVTEDIITIPQMVLSSTFLDPVCQNGTQGSIDLTVVGGTPGYTYFWNNSEITQDITNLYAGIYEVIVTDANGCTDTTQVTITDPDAIILTETHTDILCYGDSTASVDLSVANGTPAYSYDWSNGDITEDLVDVPAGLYFIDVTDINGCGGFISLTILEPDTLMFISDTLITNVLCFGDATGAINIEVDGGTGSYAYVWNTTDLTQDINNLTEGEYSVTVTDDNGCTLLYLDTIFEPTDLVLSDSMTPVLCFGESTGAVDLTVTGGVPNYTYQWDNTDITEDIVNVPSGVYSVVVTDSNGCTATLSSTVTQPTAGLSLSFTTNPVLCFGGIDGSVDLSVSGGTPGYTYQWDNFDTTQDIDSVEFGNYTVLVTDTNGCSETISASVTQPDAPLTLEAEAEPICFGDSSGVAFVYPEGGTPGYFYVWSTDSLDTLDFVTDLIIGDYFVTVSDVNGCTEEISVSVLLADESAGCVVVNMPNVFTPNGDDANDVYKPSMIMSIRDYKLTILNRWGNVMFESNDYNLGWDGTVKGKKASHGVYFYIVEYTDIYGTSDAQQGHLTLIRE
ncbi:MAG: gliding motility-associated C-terminal domain-containing protein [Lishizhenia sp.]